MVQVLIEEEFVSKKGEARHANERGRENMGLLNYKVLRAIFLADRESRYVRA